MFRLSFRVVLGVALVVVNVGLAAVVAFFAYHAAHDAFVEQSLGSVGVVADGRARELSDMLERRHAYGPVRRGLWRCFTCAGTMRLLDRCGRFWSWMIGSIWPAVS